MATPAWSILPEEWKALLTERGLRPFRADQILQALYRDYITDWDQATTLPKDFRETLKCEFPILPAEEVACDTAPDGTKKLLLKMSDGELVETVVIPVFAKGEGGGRETVRLTQCVSSQIGCAMGCAFCASGAKGIVRSLRADEIVAEVMAARKARKPRAVRSGFHSSGSTDHAGVARTAVPSPACVPSFSFRLISIARYFTIKRRRRLCTGGSRCAPFKP